MCNPASMARRAIRSCHSILPQGPRRRVFPPLLSTGWRFTMSAASALRSISLRFGNIGRNCNACFEASRFGKFLCQNDFGQDDFRRHSDIHRKFLNVTNIRGLMMNNVWCWNDTTKRPRHRGRCNNPLHGVHNRWGIKKRTGGFRCAAEVREEVEQGSQPEGRDRSQSPGDRTRGDEDRKLRTPR